MAVRRDHEAKGAPAADAGTARVDPPGVVAPDGRVLSASDAARELADLAATLQASLLPPRPPAIPGMEVASHYRPADRHVGVGGDFYDVFRVGANDWAVVIGDVCGKGARAANLAALARYALRAAAVHHEIPSDVLQELNSVIVSEPPSDDRFCSVVFSRVELDTCGAWVTLASGGHPHPIVVRRAGWIDVRGHAGSLIGMFDRATVEDDRVGLGPGDAVFFCTDGIVEARNAKGEMYGEEALPESLLATAGRPASTIAARVIHDALAFAGGTTHDDAAVVVIRVPDDAGADPVARLREATGTTDDAPLPLPGHRIGDELAGLRNQRPAPPREARMLLDADTRSPGEARRFVAGVLHSWRMSELVGGDIELLTSEVASNAVRHTGGAFTVVVRYDGALVRVEIGDGSRVLPTIREFAPDDTSGRGLFLVEALASAWGVVPTLEGKRVWFELPATMPA
ncbi:MAG TPA: SpoIIE family protein phosphatase [Acidimicrobiales bacterium]|nr:SpoIIE family protein phosphatase [Acidimicrobiales bacterium]